MEILDSINRVVFTRITVVFIVFKTVNTIHGQQKQQLIKKGARRSPTPQRGWYGVHQESITS